MSVLSNPFCGLGIKSTNIKNVTQNSVTDSRKKLQLVTRLLKEIIDDVTVCNVSSVSFNSFS